jgi:hypothetical protein
LPARAPASHARVGQLEITRVRKSVRAEHQASQGFVGPDPLSRFLSIVRSIGRREVIGGPRRLHGNYQYDPDSEILTLMKNGKTVRSLKVSDRGLVAINSNQKGGGQTSAWGQTPPAFCFWITGSHPFSARRIVPFRECWGDFHELQSSVTFAEVQARLWNADAFSTSAMIVLLVRTPVKRVSSC